MSFSRLLASNSVRAISLLLCATLMSACFGQTKGTLAQKAKKEQDLLRAIDALLRTGMPDEGDGDSKLAKQYFETIRKREADDPRAHLAYALILLQDGRTADGLKALNTAQRSLTLAPAAKRLAIRTFLDDGRFSLAAKELLLLAAILEDTPRSVISKEEKQRSTQWMGRVVGFYQQRGEKIRALDAVRAVAGEVEKSFSKDLNTEFAAGIADIAKELNETKAAESEKEERLDIAAERERHAVMEKVFQGKEIVLGEKKKLDLSAEELNTLYVEASQKVIDNVAYLERTLAGLATKVRVLNAQIAQIRLEGGGAEKELVEFNKTILEMNQKYQEARDWVYAGEQVKAFARQTGLAIAQDQGKVQSLEAQLNKMKKVQEKRLQARDKTRSKEPVQQEFQKYFPLEYRGIRDDFLTKLSNAIASEAPAAP